ncbi:3'-5' exonuclease [Niallia taxi]|uniref:3'-5' exonuclease n=1 Tax=Niallia taxi TaxID=2499688 RepID=UPI002E22A284|nr:3'-5' exonuclease [Niallia taxi]MED4039398.1 3'-5' exonuclease [Niallia taxi]
MSLPTPKGLQKEVLALSPEGHTVVLGTAGSGKTTLAILRAHFLANAYCASDEKVLLVTFNKALVTYLNSISDTSLSNIEVRNYHRFARGYLSRRGLLNNHEIVPSTFRSRNVKMNLIKEAILKAKNEEGDQPALNRNPETFFEEIKWIQKMGIDNLVNYEQAERIGRGGTRITRATRKYFYKVYENYLELRKNSGYKYDWDDIANFVLAEMEKDNSKRYYKHIIIDEGQDFSPAMLRSLVKSVPSEGTVSYFGDVAQQIYGSRISWRQAGLLPPRIWSFEQNYRNTEQIANIALAITKLPYFNEEPDLVIPKAPVASGPKPALIEFSKTSELDWIVKQAIKQSERLTVAILVRDRDTVRRIINKVNDNGVIVQELHGQMGQWNSQPSISVGTYHSAKGLEFDSVYLPYCTEHNLPSQDRIIALEDENEAMSEEIKLLYVAVTRARRGLIISYSGDNLTKLLPLNDGLYQEFNI